MAHSPPLSPDGRPPYQGYLHPRESPPCSPRAARVIQQPTAASAGFASTPLAIRGAPSIDAPPPLPPPRHAPVGVMSRRAFPQRNDLKDSHRSIPSHSSLMGSWEPQNQVRRLPHKSFGSFDTTTVELQPQSPLREALRGGSFSREKSSEEVMSLPSFSDLTRGQPLESHNHKKSLDAYDTQIKSKIGRPRTPTRTGTLVNDNTSPISGIKPLRLDTQPPLHRLTLAERPLHAHPESPLRASPSWGPRWGHAVQTGTVSPSMISSSASTHSLSLADPRSPGSGSYEPSTAPSSLSAEHATFSRFGSMDRGSNASLSMLSSAFDESEREKNRQSSRRGPEWSKYSRGSFDQALFPSEDEPEFAAQAPPSSRASYADYPHHQAFDASLPDMGGPQGVKRKASPSLGDTVADEPPPQATRSRTPGHTAKRTPPKQQTQPLPPSYGSHPSAGLQNPSYASSTPGYGTPDQHSPPVTRVGSLSESADARSRKPSYGSLAGTADPLTLTVASGKAATVLSSGHAHARSGSQQETGIVKNRRDGGIQASHIHVCDCCPKKPKKFNTLEELQVHQREKQFYCTYCHNRFKNKNEAERHQNSLHLRKQSWSCAQLGNNIDRAFHPCTATPSINPQQGPIQSSTPAEFDICGYCGKQFSNYPTPDWGERNKHLTDIHKFGECNQSKKFFRADHFRQHLKHSHQGQSGKWTNMLEQACVRDEPPPEPISQEQRQQASQALQAVQAASSSPISPYQVEALQAANATSSLPARAPQYPSAIGSHVPYEPKIDEEDEGRA